MLAEVGNKGFKHNFDEPNPKILVTKLGFVFQCINLYKTKWWSNDQFCTKEDLCAVLML